MTGRPGNDSCVLRSAGIQTGARPTIHRFARMKAKTLTASSVEIRANRLDLLSRLADDLAHEVKNPLHAMVVNLALLERRVATGDTQGSLERVDVLEHEVGRLHTVLEALLQLLRPDAAPALPRELDEALGELLPVLEIQGKLASVKVGYEAAGAGAGVVIRRSALRHTVLNLAANALEAMRSTGGRLSLRSARTADEVQLRVSDTGPGIAPADAERIGTPGFSTGEDRAGLGVAVARALVEEAGGRLELEATGADGTGATFLLALPLQSSA